MLLELLKKHGYAARAGERGEVVIRTAPSNVIGHAGRVRLVVAEALERIPTVRAVYNPETGKASIHVRLRTQKHRQAVP